jgi:Flp pilus assembly protein TadG
MVFVLVPMLALVAGSIDYGLAMYNKTTLQNAVANGVRYAVTYRTKAGYCMDDSIRMATQAAAMGLLGSSATPNPNVLVRYYSPTDLATELTGAGANSPLNIVEVAVINHQWQWITNLSGVRDSPRSWSPLNIVVYSSDRLGVLAPGVVPPCR